MLCGRAPWLVAQCGTATQALEWLFDLDGGPDGVWCKVCLAAVDAGKGRRPRRRRGPPPAERKGPTAERKGPLADERQLTLPEVVDAGV